MIKMDMMMKNNRIKGAASKITARSRTRVRGELGTLLRVLISDTITGLEEKFNSVLMMTPVNNDKDTNETMRVNQSHGRPKL